MSRILQAADLFCGAVGTSTGLLRAAVDLGRRVDLLAVNHWNLAIDFPFLRAHKSRRLVQRHRLADCHSGHQPEAYHADNRLPILDSHEVDDPVAIRSLPSGVGILFARRDGQRKTSTMTPHQRSSAEAATAQAGDNLTPLHLELTDAHLRKLRKIRRRFFKSSQDLGCVALWALNMALLHHEHTIGQIEAFVRYRADEGFTIEDSDRLLHSRLTR